MPPARASVPASAFTPQALPGWKRAVLKVGSSLLAAPGGGLHAGFAQALATFVADSRAQGHEVIVVSSGAVAAGRAIAHRDPTQAAPMAERQALAALGQARLIGFWQGFFDTPVAQVLLTHDDLRDRRRYLNARATLKELLQLGAIPVINENDTVSVDELKLGDNDNLAAFVAALVDADVLLIATDIGGLFDANPRTSAEARPLDRIDALDDTHHAMAGGAGSASGTGGMATKLQAAARAGDAGIDTVLFDGTDATIVAGLAHGQLQGTRIVAPRSRMAARKYWLRHAPTDGGRIVVDAGAAAALAGQGASLLAGGVTAAEGDFRRGDMVDIVVRGPDASLRRLARGVTQYSAVDVRRVAGRHSRDIAGILGYHNGGNVVHRDDLVLLHATADRPA